MNEFHVPVSIEVVEKMLLKKKDGIFVDATLGGGGHSEMILQNISKESLLIAIDTDIDAINFAQKRLEQFENKILIHDNFKNLKKILSNLKIDSVDGILFDFGISSHQIDNHRGFSYRTDDKIDFRMDSSQLFCGDDLVNNFDEKELVRIFFEYGEEKFSRRIARKICEYRDEKNIETTFELKSIIEDCVGKRFLNKTLARIYQSIRIAVNSELENIKTAVLDATSLLKSYGRIVAMSYHSLEDRIVKTHFRNQLILGNLKLITKKPIIATGSEIIQNPRARSVKIRVAEKI